MCKPNNWFSCWTWISRRSPWTASFQQEDFLVLCHFNTSCVRDAMMTMIIDINRLCRFSLPLSSTACVHPRIIFTRSIHGKLMLLIRWDNDLQQHQEHNPETNLPNFSPTSLTLISHCGPRLFHYFLHSSEFDFFSCSLFWIEAIVIKSKRKYIQKRKHTLKIIICTHRQHTAHGLRSTQSDCGPT